jgi:hypothetical protein
MDSSLDAVTWHEWQQVTSQQLQQQSMDQANQTSAMDVDQLSSGSNVS